MNKPTIAMVGVAAAIALGALVPACDGKSDKAAPSSATSSSGSTSAGSSTSATATSATGAPADYTNLVVPASDISALSGTPFTVGQPATPTDGTPGAQGTFKNPAGDNIISVNIFVLPDAAAAVNAMNGTLGSLDTTVVGGTPQPVSVGNGGTLVAGTSPDKSKAVTVLLFTEGKASVTLHFESPPADVVPVDFATAVAQAQDSTIKKNLPA
ncbi:hypothetical protein ACX9NE_17495 [Mycobacterium sp. ML4]